MASRSILISDREYKAASGLSTIYYGRTPDSPEVYVFVMVEPEACADFALVRLSYESVTTRELPGAKKPDWYKERPAEGQQKSDETHWPPTVHKDRVWKPRTQIVHVSIAGAWIQTAEPFIVPPDSPFFVEVTLAKQIGTGPDRFPTQAR